MGRVNLIYSGRGKTRKKQQVEVEGGGSERSRGVVVSFKRWAK